MKIGLGTYALFWEWHEPHPDPMTIEQMIDRTAELGCDVFQICDDPRIEDYTPPQLDALASQARRAGVSLELGTRSIRVDHLNAYLDIAERIGAGTLRSMIQREDLNNGIDRARANLASLQNRLHHASIDLALETYEQVPTATLMKILDRLDDPRIGICLDPANCVSALEHPRDVIDATAGRVLNLHVKDFAFTRAPGWVGFRYAGAQLGTGLLDLNYELDAVYAAGREPSAIVEHWVVWDDNLDTTVNTERSWTRTSVETLKNYRQHRWPSA